jgi:hypothetical protein
MKSTKAPSSTHVIDNDSPASGNAAALPAPAYGIDFVDDTAQRHEMATPPPNRTGMPDALKAGVESLSGMDLSDVRVDYNSGKPAQLDAVAYTQGSNIHVAPGKEAHLPHEAWHVVQQRQGRVQPTMELNGTRINDDAGLEKEADVMGTRALRGS